MPRGALLEELRNARLGGDGGGGDGGGGGGGRTEERASPHEALSQRIRATAQQQPSQPELVEAEQPDWSCSACTFLNPMTGTRCEMCNTPRPRLVVSTTRNPPPPPAPVQVQAHVQVQAQAQGQPQPRPRPRPPAPVQPRPRPPAPVHAPPTDPHLPTPFPASAAADDHLPDDHLPDPLPSAGASGGRDELLHALRQRRERIVNGGDAPPDIPPPAVMLTRTPLMFGGLSRSRTPETNPRDDLFDSDESDSDSEDWE